MENNAKHFALQLGALISLYVSIGGLISLLFGVINIAYPDPVNTWEFMASQGSIRWAIALLIVFFPTYITLTRMINKGRRESGASYLSLTKWLIYLSLLVGGVVILGDLVSIIYNFLNGELTTRFLLKALTVLLTVGLAFVYYIYDARGYWQANETRSKQYGLLATVIMVVAVVTGYMHIEKPGEVRERALDERQVNDLGSMQSQIVGHYVTTNTLPETLDALQLKEVLPTAPEGRAGYTYRKTGTNSFEVCATFAFASDPNRYGYVSYYDAYGVVKNPDDWTHASGKWCFTRVVNPPAVPYVAQ
jgi:magnesium-transporting ATPase (P-type)